MLDFGTFEFEGKNYKAIEPAQPTGRELFNVVNYNDAEEGEGYSFEMTCRAKDGDGNIYMLYWVFTDVRGEEKDYDDYDYDKVHSIEKI